MTKNEKKQTLMVCVSTLCKLNGCMPGSAELTIALGSDYEDVISEYFLHL